MATHRFQAKLNQDGITEVKFLITHLMEGTRQDVKTGKNMYANFVKEVKCEHNGKVVMAADWSAGISKDPYCAFRFKGGKVGEEMTLTWKDRKESSDKPAKETEETITTKIE